MPHLDDGRYQCGGCEQHPYTLSSRQRQEGKLSTAVIRHTHEKHFGRKREDYNVNNVEIIQEAEAFQERGVVPEGCPAYQDAQNMPPPQTPASAHQELSKAAGKRPAEDTPSPPQVGSSSSRSQPPRKKEKVESYRREILVEQLMALQVFAESRNGEIPRFFCKERSWDFNNGIVRVVMANTKQELHTILEVDFGVTDIQERENLIGDATKEPFNATKDHNYTKADIKRTANGMLYVNRTKDDIEKLHKDNIGQVRQAVAHSLSLIGVVTAMLHFPAFMHKIEQPTPEQHLAGHQFYAHLKEQSHQFFCKLCPLMERHKTCADTREKVGLHIQQEHSSKRKQPMLESAVLKFIGDRAKEAPNAYYHPANGSMIAGQKPESVGYADQPDVPKMELVAVDGVCGIVNGIAGYMSVHPEANEDQLVEAMYNKMRARQKQLDDNNQLKQGLQNKELDKVQIHQGQKRENEGDLLGFLMATKGVKAFMEQGQPVRENPDKFFPEIAGGDPTEAGSTKGVGTPESTIGLTPKPIPDNPIWDPVKGEYLEGTADTPQWVAGTPAGYANSPPVMARTPSRLSSP